MAICENGHHFIGNLKEEAPLAFIGNMREEAPLIVNLREEEQFH